MKNGLTPDENLKMTNIVNLTEEKVKNLTMEDLELIFDKINELEKRLIVQAIKSGNNERIAESLKIAVYRVMQDKAQGEDNG